MILEAALTLEILRTNPKVSEETAREYSALVMEQAERTQIDPWVFHGIVWVESRWSYWALRKEGDGSCSVGLGQINIKKCHDVAIQELQVPENNLERMGNFLANLRTSCKRKCGGLGWLFPYNPGSPTYVGRVEAIVKGSHAKYDEPAVREVHSELYGPQLWWPADRRTSLFCWPRLGGDGS